MPKQRLKQEVNVFNKGLITEASPLNFPPGASKYEYNFEANKDGTRDRRFGLDFYSSYEYTGLVESITGSNPPWTFVWENVSGITDLNLLVVVQESILIFFTTTPLPGEAGSYLGQLSLTFSPTSLASVDGRLVCAGGTIAIVSYSSTGGFSQEEVRIVTRDLWGVEESTTAETDPYYRPATLDDEHHYNLQNQSWGVPRKTDGGTMIDPTDHYFIDLAKYPSNTETVWTGLQFKAAGVSEAPFERMFPNIYEETIGATPKAPKGYFLIDLLNRGASRETAVADNLSKYSELDSYTPAFPEDITPSGPSVVGSFAGRVWYAGFSGEAVDPDARSPYLNNMIFYSQLVKNKSDYAKCYQDGDPTSREGNTVVDTDGGFIKIVGMDKPIGFQAIGDNLVVIASNGVWVVKGGSDYGFTATNYKVERLSFNGSHAPRSIVKAGDKLAFFGDSELFVVEQNQFKDLGVTDITQGTIHKFYASLPTTSKNKASGAYDSISGKLRWIIPTYTLTQSCVELVLDSSIGAFTLNNIKSLAITSVVCVPAPTLLASDDARYVTSQTTVYLCIWYYEIAGQYRYSFARYANVDFRDRDAFGGQHDAEAILITGEVTGGDSSVKKQVPYLTVHMRATETGFDTYGVITKPSGCLVKTAWDWALLPDSKKFSSEKQVYRPSRFDFPDVLPSFTSPNFEVVSSKSKILGIGKSFSIQFRSEPYKDCRLVGWNNSVTGNKNE